MTTTSKRPQSTLDDLLNAVFEAERQKANGYDVLGSAAWDEVLEHARALAVCNPLTELRALFETGATSRPLRVCNITIELGLIKEEVSDICRLLGQGKQVESKART